MHMKKIAFALLTIAASVVGSVLLAEVAVRSLLPQWSDQWKMWRIDPVYARGLQPSVEEAVVHGHSGEFVFRFSTNGQGLRMDRDISQTPAAGVRRFITLGDSFTFGYGVEQNETYSAELERRLRASDVPAEVVNAGFASGFGLDTEYLFAREVAVSWQPSEVIIGICLDNDLGDLGLTLWTVSEGRLESITKNNDWVPAWVKMSGLVNLLVKSAVPRLREFWSHLFVNGEAGASLTLAPVCTLPPPIAAGAYGAVVPSLDRPVRVDFGPPAPTQPAERVETLMRALATEAQENDYKLTILLIPSAQEVQWDTSPNTLEERAGIRKVFSGAAERAGLRVVDPVVQMRQHWCEQQEPLYFDQDGHWNAAGHRFIGAWLSQKLNPGL
jgi:hypothetical protein